MPQPSSYRFRYPLRAYGNPVLDFSVLSVTLASLPLPPFKESLPFTPTPSLELTVSSPPSPTGVDPAAAYD